MTYQRLAAYLTKRGYYVRALYDFEPSFVKVREGHKLADVPLFAQMKGDDSPVEHAISVLGLMDSVVLERWDSIASMLALTPVDVLALMDPA